MPTSLQVPHSPGTTKEQGPSQRLTDGQQASSTSKLNRDAQQKGGLQESTLLKPILPPPLAHKTYAHILQDITPSPNTPRPVLGPYLERCTLLLVGSYAGRERPHKVTKQQP